MERKYSGTSGSNNSSNNNNSMVCKSLSDIRKDNNSRSNRLPGIIDLLMVDVNEWRSNNNRKMLLK